ncbi:hypothetical protein KXD40_005865 [Peronospora effusa]|uniref:Uncharacterized protein n=1 Tax=Peronospora effusa TaxID=542832 RepID=A0A3M6VDI2_9STRA|nr:hypothetical protein DD238_003179 [Peronospora effusa]UIZ27471.1 hypothetical protein KXD40_005865 [Peronospora effusa]
MCVYARQRDLILAEAHKTSMKIKANAFGVDVKGQSGHDSRPCHHEQDRQRHVSLSLQGTGYGFETYNDVYDTTSLFVPVVQRKPPSCSDSAVVLMADCATHGD